MAIRVVIADDQPVVRVGFRTILEAQGDIEVVGEGATGPRRWTWPAGYTPTLC